MSWGGLTAVDNGIGFVCDFSKNVYICDLSFVVDYIFVCKDELKRTMKVGNVLDGYLVAGLTYSIIGI